MITYRPAQPDDRPFIVSGWSASLKKSRNVQLIAMDDWATIMHAQIDKVMQRSRAVTIVRAGDVLSGFICAAPADNHVFYIYVAQPFRGQGIARELFGAVGIDPAKPFGYACQTKRSWMLRAKTPLAIYDPFYARYPERTT